MTTTSIDHHSTSSNDQQEHVNLVTSSEHQEILAEMRESLNERYKNASPEPVPDLKFPSPISSEFNLFWIISTGLVIVLAGLLFLWRSRGKAQATLSETAG
ncbi:hypothetical protein OAK91_06200 [Planctomycetaceae bacterium]|nr:hypothetical protein [Planctomycetaceae bacterium]